MGMALEFRTGGPVRGNHALVRRVLRAYVLGHLATTAPRILSIILSFAARRTDCTSALEKLRRTIAVSLAFNRFPAFCASLVGAYNVLQKPFLILIRRSQILTVLSGRLGSRHAATIYARFLAAFVASWFSFGMLNSTIEGLLIVKDPSHHSAANESAPELTDPKVSEDKLLRKPAMVGRTIDLTLLAAIRAIETTAGVVWTRYRARNRAVKPLEKRLQQGISHLADAGVFSLSAGMVMWAWVYLPERLPRSYNKWIKKAAQVDVRLLTILRHARDGSFVYGMDTGEAPILQSMCEDYNWPPKWGDPAVTIPIPCEMVHMGTGPSCHWHAVSRFFRAFQFAFTMYLPLQLLVKARKPSTRAIKLAIKESLRSSAFLGAFISLFYYSVCLARTKLGPKVCSHKVTPMMWDSGLCVGAGCLMCGWSILLEPERRRQELAYFVAPRAVATMLPRRYDAKYLWREQAAFSASVAVLFAYVQENPLQVRGVLGQLLHQILR